MKVLIWTTISIVLQSVACVGVCHSSSFNLLLDEQNMYGLIDLMQLVRYYFLFISVHDNFYSSSAG